jgi:hypothetical protein
VKAVLRPVPRRRYDKRQLRIGTRIEMEHTRSRRTAAAIAKHHLAESADYYRELPKMERRLHIANPLPRALANFGYDDATDLYYYLAVASSGVCAYHGYKRNDSVGWALVWAVAGMVLPVVTPAVAIAQGFGKRASA